MKLKEIPFSIVLQMRRSAEVSYICSEIMHIICRFTYENCEKCLTKQSRF